MQKLERLKGLVRPLIPVMCPGPVDTSQFHKAIEPYRSIQIDS